MIVSITVGAFRGNNSLSPSMQVSNDITFFWYSWASASNSCTQQQPRNCRTTQKTCCQTNNINNQISEPKLTPQLCFPQHLSIRPTLFNLFFCGFFFLPPWRGYRNNINLEAWRLGSRHYRETDDPQGSSEFCHLFFVRFVGLAVPEPCFRRGRWWGVMFF